MLLLFAVTGATRATGAAPRLPIPATRTFPFATDVRAIARDPDGYLWFAARAGVFRFDGLRPRRLDDPQVPTRPRALAITEDGLWMGGEGKRPLARLVDDAVTSYPLDAEGAGVAILQLTKGPGRSLLVATTRGVFVWEAGRLRRPTSLAGYGRVVSATLTDRRGRIWIGGGQGLAHAPRLDGAELTWVDPAPVRTLVEDDQGGIWTATDGGNGIVRFGPDGGRHDPAPTRQNCHSLLSDRPGELWAACEGRILRFVQGRLAEDLRAPPTVDPRLISIQRDADGSLWIGARESGVVNLDPDPPLVTMGTPEGLGKNVIFSVSAAPDGSMWIVQPDRVSRWTGRAFESWPLGPAPRASLVARDGTVWIADGTAGLHRGVNGRFEAIALPAAFTARGVRSLHEDPDGTLWLGLERGGLAERRDGTFRHHALPFASKVVALARASRGGLWLATDGEGLCHWADERAKCWRKADGLGHDTATTFLAQGDRLWIGTGAGLARLEGDRLQHWGPSEGIDIGTIGQIVGDARGHLWLFSSRGLVRVRQADLDDVAAGRRARVPARHFGLASGMRSEEFTSHYAPVAVVAPDGAIWAATMSGVVVFDPQRLPLAPPPQPRILEARVNGHRMRPSELGAQRVPVGQGNVELEYAAPAFTRAHDLTFRYVLVGQDASWVEAGSRTTASYTNLAPGDYKFIVAAATPDGERRDEVRLRLAPPFHRTWYFLAASAAAALALIVGAFRLHGWVLRQRYAAVLDERRRIARDLHDTLEQSFVGIRLQLEAAGASAQGAGPVARAAALVDETMTEVRASIRALRARGTGPDLATALSTNVGQMLSGTPIQLAARTQGPPYRLPADVERHVLRIAQEAVTNALKHARPSRLELACDFGASELRVFVRDDGPGPGGGATESAGGARYGLQGMRERAALIRGTLEIRRGEAGGTEVELRVPRTDPGEPDGRT